MSYFQGLAAVTPGRTQNGHEKVFQGVILKNFRGLAEEEEEEEEEDEEEEEYE